MRKIPGEARSLLASYLVFAVCLCGLGSDLSQPSLGAAGPLLRPGEAEGGFPAAMASTLSRLGFLPATHRGPLRPTMRTAPAAAIWRARDPSPDPAALLARARGEIASLAGEAGGRLLRAEWRCSGGRLKLYLELDRMGEGWILLCLEAARKEEIRLAPAKREKLPPLRPSPPAAHPDDHAGDGAGDAAVGLGHRAWRGHAAAAGHWPDWRALHFDALLAHRHADNLLPPHAAARSAAGSETRPARVQRLNLSCETRAAG